MKEEDNSVKIEKKKERVAPKKVETVVKIEDLPVIEENKIPDPLSG